MLHNLLKHSTVPVLCLSHKSECVRMALFNFHKHKVVNFFAEETSLNSYSAKCWLFELFWFAQISRKKDFRSKMSTKSIFTFLLNLHCLTYCALLNNCRACYQEGRKGSGATCAVDLLQFSNCSNWTQSLKLLLPFSPGQRKLAPLHDQIETHLQIRTWMAPGDSSLTGPSCNRPR